jgi:uncharacterized protein YjbI with pentapeptide repeats
VLRDLSLEGGQLSGADLGHAKFESIKLANADLSQVICKDGVFRNVDFTSAHFAGAVFSNCTFEKCVFDKAIVTKAAFTSSDFTGSSFCDFGASHTDFSNSILYGIKFSANSYTHISLRRKLDFEFCNFSKCNLIGVEFCIGEEIEEYGNPKNKFIRYFARVINSSNFMTSNMKNALCNYVEFRECNFENSSIISSDCKSSIFKSSIFKNASLVGTDLTKSKIYDVDFSTCNLLNTRFHESRMENVKVPDGFTLPQSAKIINPVCNLNGHHFGSASQARSQSSRGQSAHHRGDLDERDEKVSTFTWVFLAISILILIGVFWPAASPVPQPQPSRFSDNGDGTVTDTQTGFIWTKDANPIGRRNWDDAMSSASLFSISRIGGWRLPSKDELEDLYHAMKGRHPFTGVHSSIYWSSTTYADYTGNAWNVHIGHGNVNYNDKTSTYHVWPVRQPTATQPLASTKTATVPQQQQGAAVPSPPLSIDPKPDDTRAEPNADMTDKAHPQRFTDNGNDTVTDNVTNLIWTKRASLFGRLNWSDAKARCSSLTISGIGGWRLPSKDELVDLTHAMKGGHPFTWVQEGYYWSRTTYADGTGGAWRVGMKGGYVRTSPRKTDTGHVWPVRASQ